ncbi:hypothetical protein L4D00_24015 [Photobacterium swingsii]|uniref:hypothetical protein n=1 Tax=Photobacterium swingsii TaxID=680026 RepID=UPI003D0D3EE6
MNGDPLGYIDSGGLSPVPVGNIPPEAYIDPDIKKYIDESEKKADKDANCTMLSISAPVTEIGALYPPIRTVCTALNLAAGQASMELECN